MKKQLALAILLAFAAQIGSAKTVGLWKDDRSMIGDGMLKTLNDAGWQTVILTNRDLSSEAKLAGLDVVFLPGGWNAYNYADFNARRQLVRYVAGGKGVLAAGFRSGYVRTANRPLFPEAGATYNRVNSPWIMASGDSELAKAIDKPFCPGGWDHLAVQVGPKGRVFATSGGDTVGISAELYGGRYVAFGALIGSDAKTEPMQGTERKILLAMLDWLAAAPKLGDADKAKQQAQAELDILRREKLWDWVLNDRGPDQAPGILPDIRNPLATRLESRLYTLEYMGGFLSGAARQEADTAAGEMRKAVAAFDDRFKKEVAAVEARVGRMGLAELSAENPYLAPTNALLAAVAAVPGKADKEKADVAAMVKRCAAGTPVPNAEKTLAAFLHGTELREKLMPAAELEKQAARADAAIAKLRPAVAAEKTARQAKERQADLVAIPGLVQLCASPDAAIRLDAVRELGRIGESKTVPSLIKTLEDADEAVRIQAILGLGWMQAKEAVPALIKLAQIGDLPQRRRATQALGQIGDPRAVDVLLANLKQEDPAVVENAILALGWLKAAKAVPALLEIAVPPANASPAPDGYRRICALVALGDIGDSAALPALEQLAATAKDAPLDRRGQIVQNIVSTPQALGLKGHADLAIAAIKAGGRSEAGVRQADFLGARDRFYGMTREFNALAGRFSLVLNRNFKDNPEDIMPYLWDGGMTGVHQAWGDQNWDPAGYQKLIRTAGEFGLRWIEVMPVNLQPYGSTVFPATRTIEPSLVKAGADVTLMRLAEQSAFAGFWSEETYPQVNLKEPEFEGWLKQRYGAGFRQKLGVPAGQELVDANPTGTNFALWRGALKTEYGLACTDRLLDDWRESQEWLSGLRKGCAFTFSVSSPGCTIKYPGLTAKAGTVIDVNGPENYQAFGRYNAFIMEMFKDGEARPAMCEFYNWYGPSPAHDARGFAQHLMHGECFYNFSLGHIFAQATYDQWSWDAKRWDGMRTMFRKARKIRDYLAVPQSAANVGVALSELSFYSFYMKSLSGSDFSLPVRWHQQQTALWTALNQSQQPADAIWTETMTVDKLNRYRVLVLADGKIVTPEQAALLRDWVKAGGVLIATGTTSLFDTGAAQQKDYGLADLFGVSYAGGGGITDPAQSDTWCWVPGGKPPFKAVAGLDPALLRNSVHRDFKPVKSLATYSVAAGQEVLLPGVAAGTTCEYDLPLGYDKVKPASAQVLASFANGDAALTVNTVGKGLVYFWTPVYPGLCHVTSEWEMQPNRLDFWSNVRELLAAMVRGGLAHQGATLPVEVAGVSKEIEVTLRQQPEKNRMMVHLLNYDVNLDRVTGAKLTIHPPAGRTVKRLFYPDTDTEVTFKTGADGVSAGLREFDIHDMLVVEWGN